MSLLGGEWELIERHEKLCGVVSQNEESKVNLYTPDDGRVWLPLNCLVRMLYIAAHMELHIWLQLTKDIVQRSYLNFKEDE